MSTTYGILLSCEHGGYSVPTPYAQLFAAHAETLQSHRGWDSGTLQLAQYLAAVLTLPLVSSTTTRLLIEMNRSLDHEQLFSEYTRNLQDSEKEKLINHFYLPYRKSVTQAIERYINLKQTCIHFSLHSFTPIWQGAERLVDIGLLFDPQRKAEEEVCKQLLISLKKRLSEFQIVFNEPYLGTADGLTTYLRTQYEDSKYVGIEIETNQKWVHRTEMNLIRNSLKEPIFFLMRR